MPPKDIHILVPRISKYVTLHGEKRFVDVLKVKDLRWEDYSGLSRSPESPESLKVEEEGRRVHQRKAAAGSEDRTEATSRGI